MNEPEDERREERIVDTLTFRLLVAANRLAGPFAARHGRELGIGLGEWRCVMALAAAPGGSGEDVARALGMERMTVSRTLRRLEAGGHATRRGAPDNRRRNEWRLTEAGWAVFDRVMPDALARDAALFGGLDAAEREAVTTVLRRLGDGPTHDR